MATAHNVNVSTEHWCIITDLIKRNRSLQIKPFFNSMIERGLNLLRQENRTLTPADMLSVKSLDFSTHHHIKVEMHLLERISDIKHDIRVIRRQEHCQGRKTFDYHVAGYLFWLGYRHRQRQEQRYSQWMRKIGPMPWDDDPFT
ncbi:MAG: hypothetical protein ACYTFW_10295 [Planctomycetota bacterium]|jgi:hypothetical protein